MPAPAELFDPAFLRTLEGLRVQARRVPAAGRHAEQRSRARGAGVEFTDVRPYTPGDDFRAIDWHVYQRLDRLYLRLFLQEEDLPVYVLLDQSGSMAWTPPDRRGVTDKSTVARRAVAAFAYVVLHHLDRLTVHPFAAAPRAPLRGLAGRGTFHRLLAWLAAQPAEGGTGLAAALDTFNHQRRRRGLLVVASDFLDRVGTAAVLDALRTMRHDLLLLRPVHPGEERPPVRGAVELVDCEDGHARPLHLDEAAADRYEHNWRRYDEDLAGVAARHRGHLLHLPTDRSVLEPLQTLFPAGVLRL